MSETQSTFISGWYAILPTTALRKASKPLAVERFGLSLVVWRSSEQKIVVMLDRCPHRGAKLSLGKVCDKVIQCPFHAYQFDADGSCAMAPELGKAIPGLKVKSFTTHESMGMVWMYFGDAPTPFNYPELEQLHDHFKGRYSQTKRIWQSHITYCVENQLDYTHVKFVHHNTIGRGYKIPENPTVTLDSRKITIYLDNHEHPDLEYFFPNVWVLRVGRRVKLMLFFAPINDTQTQFYLRGYRQMLTQPIIKHLFDGIMNLANTVILKQDKAVVASQGNTPSYLATSDLLSRHDKAIRFFRQQWREKLTDL
jgi:phenylpropionate dioxygenase-like ring-hydroxylating dioxygenase large terminal subunit